MILIYRFTFLFFWLISSIAATAQIQTLRPVSKESEINKNNYSGFISEQYANGRPSQWKILKNGKADGLWLEWYPDGALRYRAYWKNDLGNGKWEYFHPNGKLRSESVYIDDIIQGIYKSYFDNGQLQSDITYLNGKKHGVSFDYDINGTVVSRKMYQNDSLVIDEPVIFEQGMISSLDGNEWGLHFVPDGNTVYFTRRDGTTNQKRIYISEKKDGAWTQPVIAPFSTDEDESPFINHQGNKLFFASYRPLQDGSSTQAMDMNIWFVEKTNGAWSSPKPLPDNINKPMKAGNIWPANYEAGPVTDKEGNLYYWTKGSKNNGTNLYFSTLKADGSYSEPTELIEPSSHTNYDTSPHLSPDGNLLFFASDDRYDGFGGSDIYYMESKYLIIE